MNATQVPHMKYLPIVLNIPPMMILKKVMQEYHGQYTTTTEKVATNSAKDWTIDDVTELVAGVPWTVHNGHRKSIYQ